MPSHPESVEAQIPSAVDVAPWGSPFGSVKLIVLIRFGREMARNRAIA